jgi:hypothetical protein
MSQPRECYIIEREPGKWYYVLEHVHAPKNAYDWRENADAYGPFETEDKVREHLHNNHSNPGGSWNFPHDQWIQREEDETWKRMLDGATDPAKTPGLRGILFGGF